MDASGRDYMYSNWIIVTLTSLVRHISYTRRTRCHLVNRNTIRSDAFITHAIALYQAIATATRRCRRTNRGVFCTLILPRVSQFIWEILSYTDAARWESQRKGTYLWAVYIQTSPMRQLDTRQTYDVINNMTSSSKQRWILMSDYTTNHITRSSVPFHCTTEANNARSRDIDVNRHPLIQRRTTGRRHQIKSMKLQYQRSEKVGVSP